MSSPEQWRFQWPDGTWIRWNPETEVWEKEISQEEGAEPDAGVLDVAPEERWLLDGLEPPPDVTPAPTAARPPDVEAATPPPVLETDEVAHGEAAPDDDQDVDPDADFDDEEVALGPRRSAAHVISTEGEEPKSSLRPTIVAGAGVGLAVGIIVSMMLR